MRLQCLLCICLSGLAYADGPATQPTDPAVDWLLSNAATAPATEPSDVPQTQPAVLESANTVWADSRPGVITLSDGRVVSGKLSTTLRQPLRVWDKQKQQYQDVPFSMIRAIEARVISQSQEKQWAFVESGSDAKQYSGRVYPVRQTEYAVTLKDGTIVTGGVAAPIYLESKDGREIFILHKNDKGEIGQSLVDLVYVKTVRFSD